MVTLSEHDLSTLLRKDTTLRLLEASLYSVLPDDESGNEYDTRFGLMYDLVACNPIYNRLVWGYSTKILSQLAHDALRSCSQGAVLDLGCGSLAFTAKVYGQYAERPVVLADQSVKMLKMAKARLIRLWGQVPDNLIFLHTDARFLPFRENAFTTVISENLLHCLAETSMLLQQLTDLLANDGTIYFTTLVKNYRLADKYLQVLADGGKLIARTAADHQETFRQAGLAGQFATTGNMLLIQWQKI